MLQPILTMLPWLGVYLRWRLPAARRRAPAAVSVERRP
jgi:hypothetical protein